LSDGGYGRQRLQRRSEVRKELFTGHRARQVRWAPQTRRSHDPLRPCGPQHGAGSTQERDDAKRRNNEDGRAHGRNRLCRVRDPSPGPGDKRRGFDLSTPLAPGAELKRSVFFPVTPAPQRMRLRCAVGADQRELVLALPALAGLHIKPADK